MQVINFQKPDRERIILIFLLSFSTIFFIYQHSTGLSWDFVVYVLNAKYLFDKGFYFEWLRPPLAPFLIGIFSIFGWIIAEYLYIIFVSFLFFFSSTKLARECKINETLYYTLALSPFLLNQGLSVGTELLSLSLLQLFLAYLFKKGSALFLSLAFLTRYTNIIFLPLIFLKKRVKEITVSFFIFILFTVPWFLFNWYITGDPLTSIANSYAQNVKFRGYMFMSFNPMDVLIVTNYYIPFLLLGIYFRSKKMNRYDWAMVYIIVFSLISYYRTPLKVPRYLFSMLIPTVYFSSIFIDKLHSSKITILIACLNFLIVSLFFVRLENPAPYEMVVSKLDNCMLESNAWPYFNYLGIPTSPYPWKNSLDLEIKEGNRILLFKHIPEPKYARNEKFLGQFPIIENTSEYVLLGDLSKCASQHKVDKTYLEKREKETGAQFSPCEILLPKKLCLIISKTMNR